jgi:hypothetical protein
MADSLELLNAMQQVSVLAVAEQSVSQTIDVIPDFNATQLAQGLRADGSRILPDYKPLTIEIKKLKGQETSFVNLKDTGAHYRKLYADLKGDVIEYGSRDEKSDALQKKYGRIYGLNSDSQDEYVEGFLRPSWQNNYASLTGLKFRE